MLSVFWLFFLLRSARGTGYAIDISYNNRMVGLLQLPRELLHVVILVDNSTQIAKHGPFFTQICNPGVD